MMTTTPSPVNPWRYLGFVYERTPLEAWVIEKLKELDEAHELKNPEELFSPEERERTLVSQRRRRLATAVEDVAGSDENPVVQTLARCVLRGLAALGPGDPEIAALARKSGKGEESHGFEEAYRADLLEAALRAAGLRARAGDAPHRSRRVGPPERFAFRAVMNALRDPNDAEVGFLERMTPTRTVLGAFGAQLPVPGVRPNLALLLLVRASVDRLISPCVRALLALHACSGDTAIAAYDDFTSTLERVLALGGLPSDLTAALRETLYGRQPPGALPALTQTSSTQELVPWHLAGRVLHHQNRNVPLSGKLLRLFKLIYLLNGPTLSDLARHLATKKATVVRAKNRLRERLYRVRLTVEGGLEKDPRLRIRATSARAPASREGSSDKSENNRPAASANPF